MLSTLFNAFDEVQRCHKIVIPDVIRDKIIRYYIGFGTPVANLLTHYLTEMGQSSFKNMDDFTLWRHIILTRRGWNRNLHQHQQVYYRHILMKSNKAGGAHGWGAMYAVECAYISSELCDFPQHIKIAKQYTCANYELLQFMRLITNLTDRPESIFGTPTACIIQRFFRNYNNKIENEIDLRSLNLRKIH